MGTASLRAVIDHPGTELVGLYVYSDHKAGRDAGALARRPETGVLATQSVEDILALEADVVIHSARLGPYGTHDADIIRLLRSGKNVISINGYSRPQYWAGQRLAALESACAEGGTSLMSAGLNPGFVGEQLAVVASGLTNELEHLEIVESVDGRGVRQPEYLFGVLGFGADPATIDPNDPRWAPVAALNGMYEEAIGAIAFRLGLDLDRVETDHRIHAADHDIELRAGVVRKGTVSHTNWRWHGVVGDKRTLTISIHWYVDTAELERVDPPLWQVAVTGRPGLTISVDLHKHPEDKSRMSAEQYALAAAVVNSIPAVCDAPPGPVTRPVVTPFRADARPDQHRSIS
ncbi:dihydrodipicolinate reductase [Nocardia sp. NBC_00416]|uniref:dihydrodipicolinate reductase n=1 Tax=Nocardia sp. NBC_00416 TaxID=2975991 RepID=UPI002E20DEFD